MGHKINEEQGTKGQLTGKIGTNWGMRGKMPK
jgi:hypothetical protein